MEYIALDAHKHYSLARVDRADGTLVCERRLPHRPGAVREFLARWTPGSPVAVETVGNWYWLVDEIEAAGCVPRLVHAHKAKLMLGHVTKTDRLDACGLNQLQRVGTLPTVWIPPAAVRDLRELPRTRMVLVAQRTRLKNRLHATLAKYALTPTGVSDLFGRRGRQALQACLAQLPPQTRVAVGCLLAQLAALDRQIAQLERQMGALCEVTDDIRLLMTLPGVGFLLVVVIALEVGDVRRFAHSAQLAAYAGTVPRVQQSGGRRRTGPLRDDVNRYLQWAFVEAANAVCCHHRRQPARHVSRLYVRVARRRGHHKAIGAVARHLAEATYWVLTKREPYREPDPSTGA